MLPALVLGDTSTVTAQTTAEFRASGLTHLTAVSGANVTIVCGAVLMTAALFGPRLAVALAGLAWWRSSSSCSPRPVCCGLP